MGNTKNIAYSHSGDIGDIIYSLALAKYTGCDDYIICSTNGPQRAQIDKNLFESIKSLLDTQEYIKNIHFYKGSYNTPMRNFRHWMKWFSICESHFYAYGHGRDNTKDFLRRKNWITLPKSNTIKPIIINKTNRYNNRYINFSILDDIDSSLIGFVGTRQEYEDFVNWKRINIEYIQTKNLLELANVINNSSVFIGNPSSPAAISQAIGAPSIIFCNTTDIRPINLEKESSLILDRDITEFEKWAFFSKFKVSST